MKIKSLSTSQIALIMKKGRAHNSGSFLFKTNEVLENNPQGSFLVSKKVLNKAVERNRAKRITKESFIKAVLENKNVKIPQFVFLVKKEILKKEFTEVIQEMKQILVKNYIIKQ